MKCKNRKFFGGFARVLQRIPAVALGLQPVFIIICLAVFLNISEPVKNYPFEFIKRTWNLLTLLWPLILAIIALSAFIIGKQKRLAAWTLLAAVMLAGLRLYVTHIEPNRLVLRKIIVPSPKIVKPLKILHFSDIQTLRAGRHEARAVEMINRLKPDLVLFTGDLVQNYDPAQYPKVYDDLATLFNTIKPPGGFYGVMGNVDLWQAERLKKGLGNMQMLIGRSVTIDLGKTRIQLLGLGFSQSASGRLAALPLRRMLQRAGSNDLTIVMGHFPDYVMTVNGMKTDLCLAGHTHGGQIRLPGIGPLVMACKAPRSWSRGFIKTGNTFLNVSAGVGCEHAAGVPPMRFLCPPEMTLITFVPE